MWDPSQLGDAKGLVSNALMGIICILYSCQMCLQKFYSLIINWLPNLHVLYFLIFRYISFMESDTSFIKMCIFYLTVSLICFLVNIFWNQKSEFCRFFIIFKSLITFIFTLFHFFIKNQKRVDTFFVLVICCNRKL